MKKILLIGLALVMLVGMVAFAAMAAGDGWGCGPRGEHHRFAMMDKLNLTLEQRQKMLEIRQGFEKDTLALRYDLRQKNQELRKLWRADSLDSNAIQSKSNEIIALRIKLVTKMRVMRDKMKSILTPEQLKILQDHRHFHKPDGSQGMMTPHAPQ
jgi:Spy/CpxP family protein refolding chaperone